MASDYTVSVSASTPASVPTLTGMDFKIRVPGGTEVCMPAQPPPTDDCSLILGMIAPISLVMAPFGFIFCIVDILQQVKKTLEAIPDAITSLDPGAIVTELTALVTKFTCLLNAIPQLSVPYFVIDMIDMLIKVLDCLTTALNSVVTNITQIQSAIAQAQAEGNTTLETTLNASNANALAAGEQVTASLNPLTPIIKILDILLGLVPGAPSIGAFTAPAPGTDFTTVLSTMNTLKTTLQTVRSAIPTP